MSNICFNPDCQKILSEHSQKDLGYYWNYCDELCLRWHYGLKRLYRKNSFGLKFKPNPNLILTPKDRVKDYLCNLYLKERYKKYPNPNNNIEIDFSKELPFMDHVHKIQKKKKEVKK